LETIESRSALQVNSVKSESFTNLLGESFKILCSQIE
jgi:hypothetical protein